jgi:hypothetical protein
MSKEDPFDEIVRRLDLDLTFPAPPARVEDEEFYRHVDPATPGHLNMSHLWAWLGVIGGPVAIMVASLVHLILPRPVLLGVALLFVASAVFLIAQLPDRGPAEPDWPDDGAQL